MYYTGVGSRKTPLHVQQLMEAIARKMAFFNYMLRSGGADGADKAFERGAGKFKQIFYAKDATPSAMEIAAQFHPAWDRCSDYARKLHGRNSFQVLGPDLNNPSSYCICWTPDSCESHTTRSIHTGGTGTAISIAEAHNVPVINLNRKVQYELWHEWAYAA